METLTHIKTREQMREFVERLRLQTGQSEASEWRRASFRYVCAAPSAIGLEEPHPPFQPIDATMCDISAGGAGFITSGKLRPDQRVLLMIKMDQEFVEVLATVVHITQSVDTFRVGARFDFEDM